MVSSRSTLYWLWFLLFGVLPSFVEWSQQQSLGHEVLWLLITGLIGVIAGGFGGRLARPYDLIVGMLFSTVGMLGILHNLGYNLVADNPPAPGVLDTSAILGLTLSLSYSLIHLLLGLTALNIGLRTGTTTRSAVAVESARATA